MPRERRLKERGSRRESRRSMRYGRGRGRSGSVSRERVSRYEPYSREYDYAARHPMRRYEPYYDDYDYRSHDFEYLDKEELLDWEEDLLETLNETEKGMFKKEHIINKAKEKNIRFDDYTEDEFYVVVLMLFDDFKKTLGSASPELYVALAKDFLEDEDAELQGGEKLYAYYEYIVCGE